MTDVDPVDRALAALIASRLTLRAAASMCSDKNATDTALCLHQLATAADAITGRPIPLEKTLQDEAARRERDEAARTRQELAAAHTAFEQAWRDHSVLRDDLLHAEARIGQLQKELKEARRKLAHSLVSAA